MKNFEDVLSSFFCILLEGSLGAKEGSPSKGCQKCFLCFELKNALKGMELISESFFLSIGGLSEGRNSNLLPSLEPETL
jgi:hypothetical protein